MDALHDDGQFQAGKRAAGGAGVTEESVIGRIYADIRAFRIYDGPSEAHRASIARKAMKRAREATA